MPALLAGPLITRVRDKIPDGVYAAGVADPTADGGLFRVSSLYGWLDDGIQVLTQLTGWTLADWWAMAQVAKQPWYAVEPHFISLESAYSNQWPLDVRLIDESDTIWPDATGPLNQQPLLAYVRGLGSALQIGVWPTPDAADPATTLSAAITATTPDPILVASTTNFLSFGYVQIEDEIIQYQVLASGSLGTVSRGIGGTTAAAHASGIAVTHLGLWMKGRRLPMTISSSTSPVEVPRAWQSHLETYVLAQCRTAEQEFGEAGRLMAAFEKACERIDADPNWKVSQGQIRAYGESGMGPLAWPASGGVIIPALLFFLSGPLPALFP